ncbi:MAG: DUF1501 domain-containing protein [Cyanobacteriota bacterium]
MKRRSLLALLAASAGGAAWARTGLPGEPGRSPEHVLVLFELRGGNDGLNTLAPLHDPLYRESRPTLALADGIEIGSGLVLHPSLAPLAPLWQRRRLAFALGVGWADPSRSHFKAADQWATGSPSGQGPGWLATALARRGSAGPLVALGSAGCPAMEGGAIAALQMAPALLRGQGPLALEPARAGSNRVLRRMLELEQEGSRELMRLRQAIRPLPADLSLPRGGLGQQVALALQLIGSGQCPPALQLAQGGYDTHANQAVRHGRVLAELAEALAAFDAGLRRLPRRPRVTLLAVSEFGRRLRQNGSGGTDHGSASIALLLGDHLPHPFLGTYPSLTQLDSRGDLIASLSPPELYRRVLEPI